MNQNENKPLTAVDLIRANMRPMLSTNEKELADLMEQYAKLKSEVAEENADWAHDHLQSAQEELLYYKDKCSKQAQQVKQVTEERDELARLISDSPLCDTVVDPMLQRAWEACMTLCEKAEFKLLLKHAQNIEKQAKAATEERGKAVELLQQILNGDIGSFMLPSEKRQITEFINSLNAAKEAESDGAAN